MTQNTTTATNANALEASKSLTFSKPADLMRFLETGRGAIQAALPKHLNPDRMLRLTLTAFSTNPALRQCTGHSILASIVIASQLGLEPGVAGQGYLIPYKNTCTFVPGWQGLVGLLNNTGRATAWTGAVFEGDTFEFELGSHPKCRHVPGENHGDPDKMTHVYACGKVNGSEQPVIECWRMERVWKHRDKNNKVGRMHYSYNHPEMYARKVVLLQVLKYMPRSIELNNAIVAADAAEMNASAVVREGIIEMEPGDVEVQTSAPDMGTKGPERERPTRSRSQRNTEAAAPSTSAEQGGGGGLFGHERQGSGGGREDGKLAGDTPTALQAVRNLLKASRTSEKQLLDYINKEPDRVPKADSLDDIGSAYLRDLVDNWTDLLPQINPDVAP